MFHCSLDLQERLKREYKNANKTREGYIDESEEEEDITELTGAGKDMRKLMKKHEKNNAYDDSDDDKNPYASSVGFSLHSHLPHRD